MKRIHDTPRTDAVINTFNGVASKLAADLATHAEELERELNEALKKVASEDTGLAMAKLLHQRDEARKAWYEMHSSFERSRDEVEKLIRERDALKALLTKEQGAVTISRNGYVQELERELDEALSLEAMYQKVVAACFRCDPIPACQREDGQLEPPWEVIDRIRCERDKLQQWKNEQMTVNSEWDMQTVGKLLGVRLGESITSNIEPQIRKLIKQRDKLAKALEQCREDSVELLGERDWWLHETRLDYKERYRKTRVNVINADEVLQFLNQPNYE